MKTEDIIYTEYYRIDNTGKQIYEPVTTSINPVVIYSDDPYANAAFEKMRLNLTLEEIYNLSTYGKLKIEVIEKNQTYLSNAEIAALQMMSYEELYAAYIALVYAAETYGTADYNPNAETTTATVTETAPVVTSSSETTTATSVAEKTDIVYPEKTDIVTSIADKTEVVTTSVAEKTDIPVTSYGDKTEIVTGNGDKTEATSYHDKTEPIVVTTTTSITTVISTTASDPATLPPSTASTTTTANSDDDGVKGETVTSSSTPDPK